MRTAIARLTLTLAAGLVQVSVGQTPPPDVGASRIAWFDLATTNLAQSKEFYAQLFDWQFTRVHGTDQAVEIVSRGTAIGTVRVADGTISVFNGVVYVQVTDPQVSCEEAKAIGGTIAPAEVPVALGPGALNSTRCTHAYHLSNSARGLAYQCRPRRSLTVPVTTVS
jgi:predicted enzyme related to lactoylglutathione lyase